MLLFARDILGIENESETFLNFFVDGVDNFELLVEATGGGELIGGSEVIDGGE